MVYIHHHMMPNSSTCRLIHELPYDVTSVHQVPYYACCMYVCILFSFSIKCMIQHINIPSAQALIDFNFLNKLSVQQRWHHSLSELL